ncbi:hypothetical protein GGX14DRAFT_425358 [Mycena pura]|uniref:Uncharacterized protein n=1 Tax=Mycena pura TaxID=153505 RepID=A0AAD7E258_9AGAR|nr:hypothetical protein GGX14DRAFT_425358 [Mycena pura]
MELFYDSPDRAALSGAQWRCTATRREKLRMTDSLLKRTAGKLRYASTATRLGSCLFSSMSRPPPPPLLLEALDEFPAPPTFIPSPAPAASSFPANPPPSLPPTLPLPPVPGPSRISDTDTRLFLQSTGASRSRRSSKLSLRDAASRDSFASTRSDSLLSVSTSSVRSSPQTPSSPTQSLRQPSLVFAIDEHAESNDDLLEGAPLQSLQKAPLDDELTLDDLVPPVMPTLSSPRISRTTPPRTPAPHRESIALSSVAIPVSDDDTESDFDALEQTSAPDRRASSPDITTILANTPRPRLASIARRDSASNEPWEEDFIDDYGNVRGSVHSTASNSSRGFAFGFPEVPEPQSLDGDDTHLVWGDPDESDSDIDLHTSLPQLMLQHGYLSPHSKVLSNAAPAALTPSPSSSTFPGKEAPPRDTRDTPKRRVRHRDGKLLRGGIGLTTGLGWSDSEDEDAPSALTRRISSLNLNRSQSQLGLSRASSFSTSARSSSFSLSTSHLRRAQSEYDSMVVDEFGAWPRRKDSGAPPPTSWSLRNDSRLSRAQSQSSLGRVPSIRTEESAHTTSSGATAASSLSSPLLRSRSRVIRVMLANKEKPLPRTPSLRRTASTADAMSQRPRAVTVNTSPLSRTPTQTMLTMQSTPHAGVAPSPSAGAELQSAIATTSAAAPPVRSLRPLRLQPRQPVLGGDRAPVPVPPVLNVGGLGNSALASSASSSSALSASTESSVSSSGSALSASTSATSVSLLSSSTYARSPYSREPPSHEFTAAAGTPTTPIFASSTPTTPGFIPVTPTTPLYEQSGIARPRPRTGTGMVYRKSTATYSGIGTGGRGAGPPVRTPGKVVAL